MNERDEDILQWLSKRHLIVFHSRIFHQVETLSYKLLCLRLIFVLGFYRRPVFDGRQEVFNVLVYFSVFLCIQGQIVSLLNETCLQAVILLLRHRFKVLKRLHQVNLKKPLWHSQLILHNKWPHRFAYIRREPEWPKIVHVNVFVIRLRHFKRRLTGLIFVFVIYGKIWFDSASLANGWWLNWGVRGVQQVCCLLQGWFAGGTRRKVVFV